MIKKLSLIASLASLALIASPASAEGLDDHTLLLMHCEDLSDSSSNNFTLTPVEQAGVSSAESKFGSSSCLFDGTGDRIEAPDSSVWDFGADDFTVDAWIRLDTVSTEYQSIISNWGTPGNFSWLLSLNYDELQFWYSNSGSSGLSVQSTSANLVPNTWYHVAYERSGSVFRIYLDGNVVAQHNSFNVTLPSPNQVLMAGQNGNSSQDFDGYIDELRVSDIARWSGAFTPATAAYDDSAYATDSNDVLLMHCDSAADSSESNHTITANGSVISSTESQFGGNACFFDGSNDYYSIADSTDWDLSANDFTIDAWVHPLSMSGINIFLGQWPATDRSWLVNIQPSGAIRFAWKNDLDVVDWRESDTGAISANTWQHLSVVRSGDELKFFVDGEQSGVTHDFSGIDIRDSSSPLEIGVNASASNPYNGYIDEIRVSNGVARWTSNFSVPMSAYAVASAAAANIAEAATNAIASTAVPRAIGALSFVSDLVGEETEVLSTDSLDAAKAANGIKVALDSMNAADEDLGTIQAMVDQMLGLSTTGLNYQQTLKEIRAWRLR